MPSEITNVKEYGFNNPHITIWTATGVFFVGALRRQYRPVTEYLKQNTAFNLSIKTAHKVNEALYQNDVFGRKKKV